MKQNKPPTKSEELQNDLRSYAKGKIYLALAAALLLLANILYYRFTP